MPVILDCAGKTLDLSVPRVMGILNVTPDSFSDGGRFLTQEAALRQGERMVEEGAAIIDVGGESTRPGAKAVETEDELARVIPVIEALSEKLPVPISIDTSKPQVMRAAAEAGAGLINDVRALREPGALESAAACGVPVCLMHMQGRPRTMQHDPSYTDVVSEVRAFLLERVVACERAGIPRSKLLIDPGFGFGKTLNHNLALLRGLASLVDLGLPVLVGLSRKSMIGTILGDVPIERRVQGSVAAALLAAREGASILRVHDVAPTVEALKVLTALRGS